MKTKLERFQCALKKQEKYLHFLTQIGPLIIFGIPMGVGVVVVFVLTSVASEPAPLSTMLLSVFLGGVVFGTLGMGCLWLGRKLARSQIESYQKAIKELEQER